MQKLLAPAPDESKPVSTAERIGPSPVPKPVQTSAFTTAFGCPREFLNNRFLCLVISPRARGLSIGVNMNAHCNFDCPYCEVDRSQPAGEQALDVDVMAAELQATLALACDGRLRELPCYRNAPDELLKLRHVTLSGDGEPTLCPNFVEAVHAVIHVRALRKYPFFKIVLITNATGLDLPQVQQGLRFFTAQDEIWAKLDAGTQAYMNQVNRPAAAGGHPKPVPVVERPGTAGGGSGPIRPAAEGTEGKRRADISGANLLGHPADAALRMRPPAAQEPFQNRASGPTRHRPENRSLLKGTHKNHECKQRNANSINQPRILVRAHRRASISERPEPATPPCHPRRIRDGRRLQKGCVDLPGRRS